MARRMRLEQFARNGRITLVRRAAWPAGQYLELRRDRFGRVAKKAIMHYPSRDLPQSEMPINPAEIRDDFEEHVP